MKQTHHDFKVIDITRNHRNGATQSDTLSIYAMEMIEEARKAATQAAARAEAIHKLRLREKAERDAVAARDRRTIRKLAVMVLLLVATVFGQLIYLHFMAGRLTDARTAVPERTFNRPGVTGVPAGPRPVPAMPRTQPGSTPNWIIAAHFST